MKEHAERPPNGDPHVTRHATTVRFVNQEQSLFTLCSERNRLRLTSTKERSKGHDEVASARASTVDPFGLSQLLRALFASTTNRNLLIHSRRNEDTPEQKP
jgi:hypothetical protein